MTVLPPQALVQPCRDPYRPVARTADIVDQLTATRSALGECAAKVDSLRKWRDDAGKSAPSVGNP